MDQHPVVIAACVTLAVLLLLLVPACTRTRRSPVLPQHRNHVQPTVAFVPVRSHPRLHQAINNIRSMQNEVIARAQSSDHLGRVVLLVQDSIDYARNIHLPSLALPRRVIPARTAKAADDQTSTDTCKPILTQLPRASRHPKGRTYGDRLVPATRLSRIPAIVSLSDGTRGALCSPSHYRNQHSIARSCSSPPNSIGPRVVDLGGTPLPAGSNHLGTHILGIGAAD